MSKRSAGFVHLIPLLIVAFVAISVLALSLKPNTQKANNKAVLSESESGGGGHGSDSSGSSGSDSSGSGGSGSSESSNTSGTDSKSGSSVSIKPGETENEQEHATPEIENEVELEVAEGTESARVKIGKREDKFTFFERRFGAESEFPVSVDKTTRELTITTPQGTRVVAVLPDTAVGSVIDQNVIDRVLGVNGQLVEVKIDAGGNMFYEISGVRDEKFFGIFNVAVPKTVDISTQTGDITKINQDPLSQLLDTLSF